MRLSKPHNLPERQAGFTILELMVAMAIVAIVATVAIAGLSGVIPRHHAKSATRQLRATLQQAKMEAVKRNEPCLISFTVAGGGNPGVFRACFASADGDCTDAGDELFEQINMSDYPNAEINSASFTNGVSYFQFNSRGMSETAPNGANWSAGSIDIVTSADPNYSLSITLASSGRVTIN